MNVTIKQPAALNERGNTEVNEDFIYPQPGKASIKDTLFIVCDGMGGQRKGEVASKIVAEQMSNHLNALLKDQDPTQEDLQSALKGAESELSKHMKLNTNTIGMGTTMSLVYLGNNHILFAWVGNSPIFYFRKQQGILLQVEELPGESVSSEKSSIPSDVVPMIYGAEHPAKLNIRKIPLSSVRSDDYIFIGSDGIFEQFSESTLKALFKEGQSPEFLIKEIANISRGITDDDFSCYLLQIDTVAVSAAQEDSSDTGSGNAGGGNAKDDKNEDHAPSQRSEWLKTLTSRNLLVIGGSVIAVLILIFLSIRWFSSNQQKQQFENLYQTGRKLMDEKKYEEAADTLKRALDLAGDPTNETPVRSMFDEASERKLDKTRSMAQLKSLGDIAFKRDQWDQAVYYYEKAREAAIRDTLQLPEVLKENLIYAYIKLGDFFYDGENTDPQKSLANYRNALQIEATDEIKGEPDYLRASVRVSQLTQSLETKENEGQLADQGDTQASDEATKSTTAKPSLPANPNRNNTAIPTSNSSRVSRSQSSTSSAQQRKNLNDGKQVFQRAIANSSVYEYKASANYFKKAGNALDGEGAYMLAIMYHEGRGVSKNASRALQYAKLSAQKGWPSGHYLYAHLLLLRKIPRDTVTALQSLRIAAEENHPQAITRLNELQFY